MTLKFYGWPWKTRGHLFYTSSSFAHHFKAIGESHWRYSPETLNSGQNQQFSIPCDFEIWWLTLKNNRAPLLYYIKLCASLHHHMWIQTGVTVRKLLNCVLTSVTLTFDLWPRSFAWTSLLLLVIIPENFMMIWTELKRCADGETERQTDWTIHRAAWSQLKINSMNNQEKKIAQSSVYCL